MLQYEKEIIQKTTPESNLLILAKGLSIYKIMHTQLKFYDFPGAFVFVLNFTPEEIIYFQDLNNYNAVVSTNLEKRKDQYSKGGIMNLSNQTFLTDILNNNIDVNKISAIFVVNVENIEKDSIIPFIIEILHESNFNLIIRGFTDSPIHLDLELMMNLLRVNNVYIYPRFADVVQESLQLDTKMKNKRLKLTKEIEELQILIIEIFKGILNELKNYDKYNQQLKDIISDFDLSKLGIIKIICKNMVERFGYKSIVRQLVTDIKNFNNLVDILFNIDFGCFFEYLKSLWNEQIVLKEKSTWINLDSGLLLMEKATEFQGGDTEINKKNIGDKIKEIRDLKKRKHNESSEISEEDSSLVVKITGFIKNSKHNKITNLINLVESIENDILILVKNNFIKEYVTLIIDDYFKEIFMKKNIVIVTHYEFRLIPDSFKNIIFMSPNLSSARQVENIQNCKGCIENVYFMIYKDSLEEQNYLQEIRLEKESFKKLIEKYSKIPLTTFDNKIIIDEEDNKRYEVFIDYREMRSSLPYFLYRANNNLKIVTLETGDYILGQDTCVERKSIADFISSLNSGRLYFQLRMMAYKYKNCYLLIEFIGRRPCLSDFIIDSDKNSLIQRFVLILLNFPKLKIMWSSNSLETVKIFRTLQKKESAPLEKDFSIDPVHLELLLSIPGVDFYNYKRIMCNFESIESIALADKTSLINIVGTDNGNRMFQFFNDKFDAA